jgi:hypothetical protein
MSELQTFVLNYLEEVGGIAERAGAHTFDVLLPEQTADSLGIDSLQTWAFDETEDQTQRLTFSSPVVERMIEAASTKPTAVHYAIDSVRLHKTGLADLARSAWLIPNARLTEPRNSTVARLLNSYLLFNFKAALISDDKQEQIVSVLMDAQGGYALNSAEADQILIAARPIAKTDVVGLQEGRARWLVEGQSQPLPVRDLKTLYALLDRAQVAVTKHLDAAIKRLEKRSARFLTLDEARLNDYYDQIEEDLRTRVKRATGERKVDLEEKLTLTAAERKTKLTDAATRYAVRADLTLINVMLIQQPKLAIAVQLENRQTERVVAAVYDPLLHRIEPLLCEVCNLPDQRLQLCQNGHLVHADCLAPQCIDCKRVFCQRCADSIGQCSVCHEPLCKSSAIKCPDCGRVTCQAHRTLCHANSGAPVDLTQPAPEQPAVVEPPEPAPKPKRPQPTRATPRSASKPKTKRANLLANWPKGVPKPQRIEVMIDHNQISAFLFASRDREVARRVWFLSAERAIDRECECEKEQCNAHGYTLRPYPTKMMIDQMNAEIEAFRKEYGIASKKVGYNKWNGPHLPASPMRQLNLYGDWLDDTLLTAARAAFDYFVKHDRWPSP